MTFRSDIPGLRHACHQYGDHSLQRIGVWQFDHDARESALSESAYWIIFIHGGAWRDPRKDLYDFIPSIKHILSSEGPPKSAVRGFASIDYRLSPHTNFPQNPASTPATELRVAKHPDHIQDVRSALNLLDTEYKIGTKYVLIGHSAGGTLAHQVLMGGAAPSDLGPAIPLPAAIISIAGIFELIGFVSRYDEMYNTFISSAFGQDKANWDAISPAKFVGNYRDVWSNSSHLVILAASTDDTFVDLPELDAMEAKHIKDGVNVVTVKNLTLKHDDIWKDGLQVATLTAKAIRLLQQS